MLLREYEISIWEDYQMHEYKVWQQFADGEDKVIDIKKVRAGTELEQIDGIIYEPINQWFEEHKLVVIGSDKMTSECRACNAEFKKSTNGEYSLTFILYSHYFDSDELKYKENPFIKLLMNERKVKLNYKNQWYDFIIKSIDENSDTKSYTYVATALFINELAKNGLDLVFDPEQENSTGDIISLASVAVEGTDWRISGQSELIQQTNIEPLYELVLKKQIEAKNMFGVDTIIIPKGQIIYGFYSSIINESSYFQFLYRQDGNYEVNTETGAITNSINWYIDDIEYIDSCPSFCKSINTVSSKYRGERYVRNPIIEYDKRVDRFVDVYKDKDGNKILGYTENEYLTPNVVLNLITNPNDFTDTSGWEKEGAEYLYVDFLSSVKDKDGVDLVKALKNNSLTMQTTLQSKERILNTGLRDNRKIFVNNGIALNEEYILQLKFNVPNISNPSSALKGFIAFYDGMTEDGHYVIEKLKDANGNDTETEKHIFDFTSTQDITISEDGVIMRRAAAKYAVTYQEMLRKKLGFFLENSNNSKTKYIFIDIQLFKYYTFENKVITPSTVPTGVIRTIYYYYYDQLNKDITDIADIQYSYQGETPIDSYILQYDDSCIKKRTLKISKSNRFNIIQELCELFECWADFVVEHNEDGSIKRDENYLPIKYIIFKKYIGKDNFTGFKYGINSKTIQRVIDSEQIVSKILVEENNHELAIDGACSISRAKDNPTGELFFYDFKYYYTQGLLNYTELMNDLYLVNNNSPWLGYYTKMKKINQIRQKLLDELGILSNSLTNLEALTQTYQLIYTEASEALNEKNQEFANYPVTQGLTYDEYEQVMDILFSKTTKSFEEIVNAIDNKTVTNFTSLLKELDLTLTSAQKAFLKKLGFTFVDTNTSTNKKSFQKLVKVFKITKDPEVVSMITTIETLRKKYNTYKKSHDNQAEALEVAQERYDLIEIELEESREEKEILNEQFYKKYSRFIQEGSWQSQDYLDDDLFYYDAAATLAQSAMPQISYNISVIDVSSLEEFQEYDFDTGDKTTIEDTEFFGWTVVNGAKTPIQEEIIVSEIIVVLDSPQDDIIKVQNYKTKFEDLFQRINSVTTSLQYQSGSLAQVAGIITNTGEIKAETLQQSFANNSFALSNAADQNVLWDEQGITITSPKSPNQIIRLINGGVYLTANGGSTWSAAITGRGINATYINSGQIDTNLIRIMNGVWPTYRWDTNGINAYSYAIDEDGIISTINYNNYVRFNQYGIFGASTNEDWSPTSLQDIKNIADFALTWDGFLLRNKSGNGYLELSSTKDFVIYDGTYDRIKIGNLGSSQEPIYGISIRDGAGAPIMESNSDGTLWLKNKLNIATSQNISQVQIGYLEGTKQIEGVDTGLHEVINATDKFIVYEDGSLRATDGYFRGEIQATSGSFTGEINATSGTIGQLTIENVSQTIKDIKKIEIISNQGNIFKQNTKGAVSPKQLYFDTNVIGYTVDENNYYVWQYSSDFVQWNEINEHNNNLQFDYNTYQSSFVNDRLYLRVIFYEYYQGTIHSDPVSTYITILLVKDGIDSPDYKVEIISSDGLFFKNNQGKTTLECIVYHNGERIEDGITYQWYKGIIIEENKIEGANTSTLVVTANEVESTQNYTCMVTI